MELGGALRPMQELLLETARQTGLVDVQELTQYFEDVDGNEHELMVKSPSIDAVNGARLLARCEDRDNLADRN